MCSESPWRLHIADIARSSSIVYTQPVSVGCVTVTALDGAAIVAYGLGMRLITREPQALGPIVRMSQASAVLATYFRNNVLHLFALPSLIACAFVSNERVSTEDIQRLAWRTPIHTMRLRCCRSSGQPAPRRRPT